MRVVRQIVLPAEPAAAWAILMDWEAQSSWMRDADRVVVTSAMREGVGTSVAVRTRVLNVPLFTERLEVVGWNPPWEVRMAHRSFVRGVGTWTLEAAGTGTRFTWAEEIALPVPVLGEIALRVYRPFMRHLMGGAMRELQTQVGRRRREAWSRGRPRSPGTRP